jgi:hypothetical protein
MVRKKKNKSPIVFVKELDFKIDKRKRFFNVVKYNLPRTVYHKKGFLLRYSLRKGNVLVHIPSRGKYPAGYFVRYKSKILLKNAFEYDRRYSYHLRGTKLYKKKRLYYGQKKKGIVPLSQEELEKMKIKKKEDRIKRLQKQLVEAKKQLVEAKSNKIKVIE